MYTITKTMEISAAHSLNLNYNSACTRMHGHNWKIAIVLIADELNDVGMIVDFAAIKKVVMDLDHQDLNSILSAFNPTAENIAYFLWGRLTRMLANECLPPQHACVRQVTVQENEGNVACYRP